MSLDPVTTATAHDLVDHITPALADGKLAEAIEMVRRRWTSPQLIELLSDRNSDVRKVAALSLGMIGDERAVPALAVALHDPDAMVTEVAEHALWTVWFRLGRCAAICLVKHGNCHLRHGNYDVAVEKYSQAIAEDPGFAEAYNQRAIAHYLAERFEQSIADCDAALARIPQHFGAMAGKGHCYAHLKQWAEARRCYRLALAIHPRLEGIAGALHQIDDLLRQGSA